MSDILRCPFCGQKLDTDYHYISCRNPHCNITVDMDGTEELWEVLIRTRKALDVAVDKLKGIKSFYDDSYADPNFVNWHIVAQRLANDADDAIKAITALEQKDVK